MGLEVATGKTLGDSPIGLTGPTPGNKVDRLVPRRRRYRSVPRVGDDSKFYVVPARWGV
jgi:hypothetical protein